MESLVTKLKGSVEDNSLRKLDEVKMTLEVLLFSNIASSEPNELKIKAPSSYGFRANASDLDSSNSGPNDILLNGITSGDEIFISKNSNYTVVETYSRATSNGFKYIKCKYEGLYPHRFTKISANGVYNDLDTIPESNICTEIYQSFNYNPSLLPEEEIDVKKLVEKWPNILRFSWLYNNPRFINPEYFSQLKPDCSVYFYNLNRPYLDELNLEYFKNLKAFSCSSTIDGDYFGIINNSEKTVFHVNGNFKYNGETFEGSRLSQIGGNTFYVDGDVDLLLQNLANNVTKIAGGNSEIKFASYRSSASDKAVQTLTEKGFKINIPKQN